MGRNPYRCFDTTWKNEKEKKKYMTHTITCLLNFFKTERNSNNATNVVGKNPMVQRPTKVYIYIQVF